MGLLDSIAEAFSGNTESSRRTLGLLAAAGPTTDPNQAGFGARMLRAQGYVDDWKKEQMQEARAKQMQEFQAFQMQHMKDQAAQQQAAALEQARIQSVLPKLMKPASQGAPAINFDSLLSPELRAGTPTVGAVAPSEGGFDMQEAFRQRVPLKTIEEMQKLTAGPEFSPEVRYDQNGKAFMTAKNGAVKYLPNIAARDELVETDLGGTKGFRTKYSPTLLGSLPKTQTPDSVASNALGWANNSISRAHLTLAQNKAEAESANGGYSNKPLPASALKMQNDSIDSMNTASGINKQLANVATQIETGKLSFGPISNLANSAMNAAGVSTEESRNFASFKSTLEKLRNDSLRLNTGVQTDGDAQRAWNELFQNINDTGLVRQRLQEITAINKRAEELHRLKVDQIRGNYNVAPMDYTKLQSVPSGVNEPSNIPSAAINMLKMKPSLKADFDAKYGAGAADRVLGGR